MDLFLSFVASGLVIGSVYGLIGMSFAIIFRTTGVLNFAQGEVMMLVTYAAWTLSESVALPFWLLVPSALIAAAAIGIILEWLFIRPMIGQPVFSIVMVTIGLAIMLRSAIIMIWGHNFETFSVPFSGGVIQLGPVVILSEQLAVIALLAFVSLAMWLFFRFSRIGAAMRATAQDETAALLMGVDSRRMSALAWAIAAMVSGLSGIMIAVLFSRSPDMWQFGLNAFPATVLGGLDSPIGSGVGGLVIGIIGELASGYLWQGMKEVSGFAVIILILMVRPYGLFGDKQLERV